ncbi:hypothetical protein A5707_20890 [Mycobacterium kyorinense]|uniref:Uncharacterized protein n=1 Tax=Mycobacterium kyorinense TaxID=487514 RepID=A0A1A2Z801_9MYCO|nr:hypothetical protein [Mycobacterium kyorinense]OBI46734.1 hypothetical protein A5707_20890 [Mycobacterium kyorinense]
MSATPHIRRLTAATVAAFTALSIAACGNSNNENAGKPSASASPTTSAASSAPNPPPAPPMGHDHVEGLVRSVSGNTIQLTQRDRAAVTVDFTPATMVTELRPAQLTDVTHGSCVDIEPVAQSAPAGGPVPAQSVTISPSVGGKCPPPPPGGPPAGVSGTVKSVTGNAIAVDSTDPTGKTVHTDVNVSDSTTYQKHAVTNEQAIQNGKCLAAQGTQDSGVLHADSIDLEPCPPMGRPHHHFRIPRLPHFHR